MVLAGCQSSPRAQSPPAAAAEPAKAPRDTIPFDESEIVKPALHYGSFHVASDSARAIVARSLGAWADSATWRRDPIAFDYRDSIQVMAGDHPMWVLGSRLAPPVPGWTMTLVTHSDALEGERTVLGGLRDAGWVEDGQYGADGTDGSTLALVSEEAICFYSASWDGGDDSDSTYVPLPGMSIRLECVPRFPVHRGPLVRSR